jgi:hypothetical protein
LQRRLDYPNQLDPAEEIPLCAQNPRLAQHAGQFGQIEQTNPGFTARRAARAATAIKFSRRIRPDS